MLVKLVKVNLTHTTLVAAMVAAVPVVVAAVLEWVVMENHKKVVMVDLALL
tara:strand:+ start:447 stop:599 length:153 start_codon:yes stop_codon:yes gene_type:complete